MAPPSRTFSSEALLSQVKRLLQSAHPNSGGSDSGACLFDLLMGIEVLQQPLLDLLLDTLLQLCHQQPRGRAVGGKSRRQAYPGSPGPASSLAAAAYSRCLPAASSAHSHNLVVESPACFFAERS